MAISQYDNEYYGLSGDVKPLGTPLNGRKFTEMDTSKEYRFDAENQQWLQQYGGGGGGSSSLSGLTDVDISNPTDGQMLVYNATSGKWENGAGGGGASAYFVDCSYALDELSSPVLTSSKTTAEIRAAMESGALVYIRYTVPGSGGAPDFTHIYSLTGMSSGTGGVVTRAMFSFMATDSDGSELMYTGYTAMTDNPVFAQSDK